MEFSGHSVTSKKTSTLPMMWLSTYNQQQMQEKTIIVAANSARRGHIINGLKSKVVKINASNNTPITVQSVALGR
ncbi:hypothetical protein DPMN_142240 [Dreissena polymorpha]|uniref:Uncharacterized protein n=1 Tax=Dreissena polymorpha TaxID=45954 RepID=A0A9D4JNA7_DREPO|nr:hypothetical protein DPMN_142240 [Dreissena polymorpha]